ncbi:MAG: N-formylglutamate amidohydrolase [Balneolaceae bacterium]|nr:N-formylglutamate amidohydrolase [Balneolaceae bacterium]
MESPLNHNIIISCEHASNDVPAGYKSLFTGHERLLKSHRGWDPGAIEIAKTISKELNAPLFSYPYTRLLIEPNRSIGHPKLFSEISKPLSKEQKNVLIHEYYLPYRSRIIDKIEHQIIHKYSVLHLSIHTFVPKLDGKVRDFDIGILYDPKRTAEKEFSKAWKRSIRKNLPKFKVKMNQPYKGTSDGFTTALRDKFNEMDYLGIELEVNQKSVSDIYLPKFLSMTIHLKQNIITCGERCN